MSDSVSAERGQSTPGDQDTSNGGGSSSRVASERYPQSSARRRKTRRLIPIAVIAKSALFRAGLVHILAGSRFRIAVSCSSLEELPGSILDGKEAMALISLDDEAETLLPRVSILKARGVRIILLCERFSMEQAWSVMDADADGYLLKNGVTPDTLLKSLELVLLGGVVIPPEFIRLLNERVQSPAAAVSAQNPELATGTGQPNPEFHRLSNRERVILGQLTQGASNKQIARELGIAEATVKVHVKSLLRKIGVNNRTLAAVWAVNHIRPAGRTALPSDDLPQSGAPGKNTGRADRGRLSGFLLGATSALSGVSIQFFA
jgi:two-component system, NarL family, nitrate/nitrite response regulator NarL